VTLANQLAQRRVSQPGYSQRQLAFGPPEPWNARCDELKKLMGSSNGRDSRPVVLIAGSELVKKCETRESF